MKINRLCSRRAGRCLICVVRSLASRFKRLMAGRKQARRTGTAKQGPLYGGIKPSASTGSSLLHRLLRLGFRRPGGVLVLWCHRMFRSSLYRGVLVHETGESLLYRPGLLGVARLHYAERKAGVDYWETLALVRRIEDAMPDEPWDASEPFDDGVPELDKAPEAGAEFDPLPAELARAKSYAAWTKAFKSFLYRERTLRVWNCPALKEWSRPLESERSFDCGWCRRRVKSAIMMSRCSEPSMRPSWRQFRSRCGVRKKSSSASRPRRVKRAGMRRLLWAARCWGRFWGGRPLPRPR